MMLLTDQKVLMILSLLVNDRVKLYLIETYHLGRFLVVFLPIKRQNMMYCKHKLMTTTL